jgi:recombination associated protein RdgC
MWFKNLQVYRLTQQIDFDEAEVEAALGTKRTRPCGSQEMSTYGFMPPVLKGDEAPLMHIVGGYIHIMTKKIEKMIPGSVIKDAVTEKVAEIEFREQRKVYKKERDQIKDEIIQAALPRAFTKFKITHALIMPKQRLIIVDASSPSHAEDLLSTLRKCLGTLPVRPMTVKIAPAAVMTEWVRSQESAPDFYILDECILRDIQEGGGSITAKAQDLTSDEIKLCIESGKLTTQLSLAWKDKLSFVLNDQLQVRRLKFDDLLQDRAEQDGGDDARGQLDAAMLIMGGTFAEFIPALAEAMGGEEFPEGLGADTLPESTLTALANIPGVEVISAPEPFHGEAGNDPLYAEAVGHVRETKRASISSVQRKLKIGYNRAARMIEQMEIDAVITPMNTNGNREIIAQ